MDPTRSRSLRVRVEAALDQLRPALVADGGGVEVVDVGEDGTVQVVFLGACATCPAQLATLRLGLEERLREALPELTGLVAVPSEPDDPPIR
jgi:Fe-S cluster biogenesis protein NfuA